jgi:hypothetical protein
LRVPFEPPPQQHGWIGSWTPGLGDPSILGWLTVACYLYAAWQCFRLARSRLQNREGLIWWALALGLFALGINKQLDLQSALTEIGRIVARRQHWYDQRREVQVMFIGVVALLGLGGVTVLLLVTRRAPRPTRLATLGAAAVLTFVVIRAASFHHFDRFIRLRFAGFSANWILEVGGLLMVIFAALSRRRTLRSQAVKRRQKKL